MVPDSATRRDVLALSGVTLAGLAGCGARGSEGPRSGVGADGDGIHSPTATERSYANEETAPASRTLRNQAGNPAVVSSAHEPGADPTPSEVGDESSTWIHEHWLVRGPAERDALEYSDSTSGVESARAFVADTDLSTVSLLVQQYGVANCTTVEVQRIRWSGLEDRPEGAIDLRVDYEERERDDDCEHDGDHGSSHGDEEHEASTVVEATMTRIPVTVETVRSFAYGW